MECLSRRDGGGVRNDEEPDFPLLLALIVAASLAAFLDVRAQGRDLELTVRGNRRHAAQRCGA